MAELIVINKGYTAIPEKSNHVQEIIEDILKTNLVCSKCSHVFDRQQNVVSGKYTDTHLEVVKCPNCNIESYVENLCETTK